MRRRRRIAQIGLLFAFLAGPAGAGEPGLRFVLEPALAPCCAALDLRGGLRPQRLQVPAQMPGAAGAEEGKERSRRGLYLSAALALAGGAVALWSKGEADAAYDKYLSSASPHRQTEHYDRARRYDHIAGAAFLAMEAGLVLTTYLLFF